LVGARYSVVRQLLEVPWNAIAAILQ
jgi:hypothetical protein